MLSLVHAVLLALAVAVTAAGDKAAPLPAKVPSSTPDTKLRGQAVSQSSRTLEGDVGIDEDTDRIEDDGNYDDLDDDADEVEDESSDDDEARTGAEAGASTAPMRMGLFSRLASSKLAPIRRQLQSAMTGQGYLDDERLGSPLDKDSTAAGAEKDAEVSTPDSGSGFMFMVVAFALRIGMSLLMLWFQMRRRGGGEGTDATGGSIFDSLSKASFLGSIVAQVQHGFSYIAAFARSPSAAPVMIALLILGTKLIKGMDAEPEAEAEGVEVIDAEEAAADPSDGGEDAEAAATAEGVEESTSAAGDEVTEDVDLGLGRKDDMDGDTEDEEEG